MKLRITIDSTEYEADIEVIEDEHLDHSAANQSGVNRKPPVAHSPVQAAGGGPPPAAEAATGPGPADDKVCKSSIMGIVVKVLATAGQVVKIGEPLLILEAMKMESNVVSPVAGTVKNVPVAQGQNVRKGQVLVEFE